MEQRLRSNADRARNAITWLWVMVGTETLILLVNSRHLRVLEGLERGEALTDQTISTSELSLGLASLVYLVVFIFTAIAFIKWSRRAFYNLQRSTTGLRYTEDWAAAAWFVPLLNLFRPYQIMRELYARTMQLVGSTAGAAHIGWWWALWITTSVLGQISGRLDMWAEDPGEMIISTQFGVAEALVGIPAAVLALSVVKRYAAMEPMLAALPQPAAPRNKDEGTDGSVEA